MWYSKAMDADVIRRACHLRMWIEMKRSTI
nr:MAG TPA: hypothetical protein [Caudoviricetes sp.]